MAVMAAARRWPTLDLSAKGATSGANGTLKIPIVNMDIQRLALSFTHPLLIPYAKFDIQGTENIPDRGPGDHRRQPPQLLRSSGRGGDDRPYRAHGSIPR
jgi:putative phosphoserine phosphatase/1-acylglycerol-3-phosphate O-acyltransferase